VSASLSETSPTPWILLRGLGRSREHWGAFVDRFRAALPAAKVETIDLPGCGARAGERAPLTVAATLAAVRDQAPRRPLSLLGLSLGGMVAYEWARRHPDELRAVVVINTSLGGLSPPWRRLRLSAAATIAGIVATGDPLARERRVVGLTSGRPDLAEVTARAWAELARRHPVRRAAVLRQLLAAARYRARPLPHQVPLLVLAGGGDRLVDPACTRALAAATPGATLREHPDAGHDLPLDDPGWVSDAVVGWLGSFHHPPARQ
jgi:pimeloyl-ACP methyl ester carboxylesterase